MTRRTFGLHVLPERGVVRVAEQRDLALVDVVEEPGHRDGLPLDVHRHGLPEPALIVERLRPRGEAPDAPGAPDPQVPMHLHASGVSAPPHATKVAPYAR